MRKPEEYTGDQARSYKKYVQRSKGSRADFENDRNTISKYLVNFIEAPNKFIKVNESKQTLKSIKDQINYFGYEIEPFHMKNERDIGNFDQDGHFVFDKQRDKEINDSWLDQLDQNNVFQELQEKAQNENSKKMKIQIKQANKQYEQKMKRIRGDAYFKSSKFESKEEAKAFYNQGNSDEEVEEEVEDKNENSQKPEDKSKLQEEKIKLEDLEVSQLKEILYELLEPDETPTSAMKRVRAQLAVKEKRVFKKNVRKSATETTPQTQEQQQQQNQGESKQTLDLLVDICTIIVEKTNDPAIYSLKKAELVTVKNDTNPEDDIF